MIVIKAITGKEALETGLAEQILEFDRENMREILSQAGIDFPEEKRRKGFENNPTVIIAFENETIVGYLEYCRNWGDPEQIYFSSLQIDPRHRRGFVLAKLIGKAKEYLMGERFTKIVTGVQKNNHHAVRLYKELGFQIEENPNNEKSYAVTGGKEILNNERILSIMRRLLKRRRA